MKAPVASAAGGPFAVLLSNRSRGVTLAPLTTASDVVLSHTVTLKPAHFANPMATPAGRCFQHPIRSMWTQWTQWTLFSPAPNPPMTPE